jgi:hypothetical protein
VELRRRGAWPDDAQADVNDYVPAYQFTSVNADQRWAEANRLAVVAFLRALRQNTEWVFANRDAAAPIVAREMRIPVGQARRACDDFFRMKIMPLDLEVSMPGLRAAYANVRRVTAPSNDINTQELERFLDLSFWRESRAS